MHQLKEFRTRSCIGSNPMEQLSVELKERAEEAIAQFACIGSDRVKNRLDAGRRAPNYAKDVAGGRLLLECASKLCATSLGRLEQTSGLDGDDGLVGEGLEQPDLLVGERSHLVATDCYCANCFAGAHQRNDKNAVVS